MFCENTWETSGRDEFVQKCRKSAEDPDELRKLLYLVCSQVISGQLRCDLLTNGLMDLNNVSTQLPIILADILVVLDIETQANDSKEQRDLYVNLLNSLSNTLIADCLLKERLDYDTAGEAKIVPSKQAALTKFIKVKTRLFYKQQKFNLLREESEGYAKLITELCKPTGFECDQMLQNLRSLIGCFNLDPNRVLDVVLECFECRLNLADTYIPLLRKFLNNSTTMAQILGFKFGFYHNENGTVTPQTLQEATALLLKAGLISLDQIYEYLIPTDKSIYDFYDNELKDARVFARKSVFSTVEDKSMDDDRLSDSETFSLLLNNQKLDLCLALLKVGDWVTAKTLIDRLPFYYVVGNRAIAAQLCRLIHYSIDIVYHSCSGISPIIINKIRLYEYPYPSPSIQAKKISDLKENVFPMIIALGPYLHDDTLLISKVVRIGKFIMNSSYSEDLQYDLLNLLDASILPSMSLIESNCGLADELWQFVKTFHYTARYTLYSSWKREPDIAILIRTRALTMKRIKYLMKRLSKENVKFSGRHIGKISHSNPSFLFEYIISQIQSYDNLIGPVVDSMKYLTSLSYDVLVYCIIEALSNSERNRDDGATISPWLLTLAHFIGSAVKKYPLELVGLFQFIANQLKAERSLDLLVLKEIIQKMAGIEAAEAVTEEQVSAMSGGELLRAEGAFFNQVRNIRKSSIRLKDTLLESNLAMPLCILIAQQRNCILYSEQEYSHIKLLGKLYDMCQETLVQYGAFLSCNLSIDDYIGRLPSLAKLITDYHLSADAAFFLARPMIVHNINLRLEDLKKSERSSKDTYLFIKAWEQVTEPIVDAIIPAFPCKFWDNLSPRFFVTFWTLSMYDLEVPNASYEKQCNNLRDQMKQIDENKELAANKKKKEIERCRLLSEKLSEEQTRQLEHVRRVRERLERERNQWFHKAARTELTTQFLQHCLFPRCLFTANDALYCAEFVHLLHAIKTLNFSTLICYDRIFNDITYSMSSCTENEANHYGRFLCALLETVMRWHKDKAVFEKECAKFPGFLKTFNDKEPTYVDYEDYRNLCHKWHYRLTKAFVICLDSGDYVQIRNGLIVLTKIINFFPRIDGFARAIEDKLKFIRNTEQSKRPDIYALAIGYSGQLVRNRPNCVRESEFHNKPPADRVTLKKDPKPEPKQEVKTPGSSPKSPKERKESAKPRNSLDNRESSNDKPKNDTLRSMKKDEKSVKSDRNHFIADKSKSDHKSAQQSPKRGDSRGDSRGRSVEPIVDSDREYKRRKVESKNYEETPRNDKDRTDSHERRKEGEDSRSSSPTSNRSHEKKSANSSRKREVNDESPGETNIKKRRDEESNKSSKKTPTNEDRDSSRKSSEKRSSSRRSKPDDK